MRLLTPSFQPQSHPAARRASSRIAARCSLGDVSARQNDIKGSMSSRADLRSTDRISFCKCECGLRYKVLQELGSKRLHYTCECGRPLLFIGDVVALWFKTKKYLGDNSDWISVPLSQLERRN